MKNALNQPLPLLGECLPAVDANVDVAFVVAVEASCKGVSDKYLPVSIPFSILFVRGLSLPR